MGEERNALGETCLHIQALAVHKCAKGSNFDSVYLFIFTRNLNGLPSMKDESCPPGMFERSLCLMRKGVLLSLLLH